MDISFKSPVPWIIAVVALIGAYKLGELNKTEEEVVERADSGDAANSSHASEVDEEEKSVEKDDWEWPIYDTYRGGKTELRVKEKVQKPKSPPFEVIYSLSSDLPDSVEVGLRSKSLIKVAKECLPKHIEKFVVAKPRISGMLLFIALSSFEQSYQSMQMDDKLLDVKHHLKHLIRFLETEYADTKVLVERTIREDRVRWDHLWVFIHRGERVYYTCAKTGQRLLGIVQDVWFSAESRERSFSVSLQCRDYNGRKYVKGSVKIVVDEFKTEDSFQSIGIGPMSLLGQSERDDLEAKFLSNGRRFYEIVSQRSRYMQYEGPRIRMEWVKGTRSTKLVKYNADGRVMVDLLSFARLEPGYSLQNATPWDRRTPHTPMYVDTETPSEDELMLAPAIVYGFSFANKQWGAFDIRGLSAITFNDKAYDCDLVLSDPFRKKMLLDLVSEHLKDPGDGKNNSVPKLDPISNKGDGCIFLCYGPPGTGKTLTAESIAEKLKCPLWAINVFELGRTPEDLERRLIQILDIASRWRAVLLLDEADIYMEKRTSNGDPDRTAMTSIFLRLIEYYRGVLFLTTNRVASFDDAFCSRISVFLQYHRLDSAQRKAVWSNLFARAGIENPDLTPFTETELNGREIRNTVRMAQMWAKSSGKKLTTDHVVEMVKMVGEFQQNLEEAILNEPDDRSITQALARVRSMKFRPDTAQLNGN